MGEPGWLVMEAWGCGGWHIRPAICGEPAPAHHCFQREVAGTPMSATFIANAQAAAGPLFEPGAWVGERIEASVSATWAVAGCNTNLGILLLCAPIAKAVEMSPDARSGGLARSDRSGAGQP